MAVAAPMRVRWLNAWGKLPTCRWRLTSYSEPAIHLLAVFEVEPHRARRILEQRFVSALDKRVEELRGRINHHPTSSVFPHLLSFHCDPAWMCLGERCGAHERRELRPRPLVHGLTLPPAAKMGLLS
jgi:hypothetical protein